MHRRDRVPEVTEWRAAPRRRAGLPGDDDLEAERASRAKTEQFDSSSVGKVRDRNQAPELGPCREAQPGAAACAVEGALLRFRDRPAPLARGPGRGTGDTADDRMTPRRCECHGRGPGNER